jgi:hypothetical protein
LDIIYFGRQTQKKSPTQSNRAFLLVEAQALRALLRKAKPQRNQVRIFTNML